MVSFTGQINYYTKIQDPRYSAFTVQNFYQPSNYYDTIEKIPDELQDSFQQGVTQVQEIANQLPENEDINIRIIQDQFFRSGGLEIDLRKPNLEQSTFKAGPIGDLQNLFENFIYEVQNKLFLEQEQTAQTQPTQSNNPYEHLNPQQNKQQNNQYSNPFAPIQATDAFKEETLYDNMNPDEIQTEDAGNAQNVPFSYAPQEAENQFEQGGYEGVNNQLDQHQNPYGQQDYTQPAQDMAIDSSYDFNQTFDPGSIYI